MTTAAPKSDEAQIRTLVDEWADGVRTKNVGKCMTCYAADILLFDLAPPLRYTGANAYRKNLEEWFPTFEGPIGYKIRDLQINVSGDVTTGEETDIWVRATAGRMSTCPCPLIWTEVIKRRLT